MPVGGDDSTNDTMIERKGTEVFAIIMMGKPWLSSEQNARDGMTFPGVKPSDMHQL